jgi:hypothetical protein
MTMKTTVLTLSTLLLAVSTSFAGGDTAYHTVTFRGTVESASGVAPITEKYFVAPGNFMVAGYDLLSAFDFLSLQEWSDTNADGIPETYVRELFRQSHSATLPSRNFAVNLTDTVVPAGEHSMSVSGKVKVKNGVQTGFTAKVVGALDSLINGSVVDSIVKGTMTTRGSAGAF